MSRPLLRSGKAVTWSNCKSWVISDGNFSVVWDDDIEFDLLRKLKLIECEKIFQHWVVAQVMILRKLR